MVGWKASVDVLWSVGQREGEFSEWHIGET